MSNSNIFCEQELYNQILIYMPVFCMDLVIKNNLDEVLLIKRNQSPAKNEWWTVGGRLFKGENFSEGAIRKAKSETGLDCKFIKIIDLINMYFEKQDDMFCNIHTPSLIIEMEVINIQNINLDKDHLDYKWIKYNSTDYHEYVQQILKGVGLIYE